LATQTTYPESDLLLRVAQGDQRAFAELFSTYWDQLYGFALSVAKSPELAEEIVQDSFVTVWQNREKLPELDQFRKWLFTIVRNRAFDLLRKKLNDPKFVEHLETWFALSDESPEKRILLRETRELIDRAAEQLSPQQRIVFTLSRSQELSLDEIAVQTGLSKNTVKVHLARALQSVRAYLRDHAHGLLLAACLFELF
jgi:RNA polymerase sigma-70 factor (family 1)